jgi:mRNA-degrading endonuclease RelE of RelBE toxin-antitoxin system
MKLAYTPRFLRDYARLDAALQRRTEKQIRLLLANPRHPSLRIHKMEGHLSIFEARVTKGYRFTFQVTKDIYVLRRVGTHDILKTP